MKHLLPNLIVGNEKEYNIIPKDENFILAAKNPFHMKILGQVKKDHPDYLYKELGSKLILNIIDAPNPLFFSPVMMNKAVNWGVDKIKSGKKVYVICNQGKSRSCGIACAIMFKLGKVKTIEEFKKLCPQMELGEGMKGWLEKFMNLSQPV